MYETCADYLRSRHPDRVPGLLPGVSTSRREPGYRVVDRTWEARMKCSVKGQQRGRVMKHQSETRAHLTEPCHLLGAVVRMLDAEHPDSNGIAHW